MRRGFGFGRGRLRGLLGAVSQYAAYALALPFKTASTDGYWKGGTKYATINLVPGYAYTRTGQVGFVNQAGGVDYFAANVPPIENGIGYEAYGAVTNTILQSQAFDDAVWTADGVTTAINTAVAPDGATTADKINETATTAMHRVYQAVTYTAGTSTASVFVKAAERSIFWIDFYNGGSAGAYFNLSTGLVGTTFGAVIGAYLVPLANGWYRAVVTRTTTAGSGFITYGVTTTDNVQTYAGTAGNGVYLSQGQVFAGNFPDGGPIIVTTTAAVTIPAQTLGVTLANGTYSAVYTFDDASTQTIPTTIAAGAFNMPNVGTLNRPVVRLVTLT